MQKLVNNEWANQHSKINGGGKARNDRGQNAEPTQDR